jgi:hypothetical protein
VIEGESAKRVHPRSEILIPLGVGMEDGRFHRWRVRLGHFAVGIAEVEHGSITRRAVARVSDGREDVQIQNAEYKMEC